MAIHDISNQYADALGEEAFRKTSKNVYAAIAFSFAMRLCEDNQEAARKLIGEEWQALHAAGIIPQKPAKSALR